MLRDVLRLCGVEPEVQHPIPDPRSLLVCGPIQTVLQYLGLVLRISCHVFSLLCCLSTPPGLLTLLSV